MAFVKRLFITILGVIFIPLMIIMLLRLINGKELFISMSGLFNYISTFEFFQYTIDAVNDLQTMVGYFDTLAYEGADVFEYVKLIGNILISTISGVFGILRDLFDVVGFLFGIFSYILTV